MIPAVVLFVLIPLLGAAAVALLGVAGAWLLRWQQDRHEAARLAALDRMRDHWASQALDGRTLLMDIRDLSRR